MINLKKLANRIMNSVRKRIKKITYREDKKNDEMISILESLWASSHTQSFLSSSPNKSVWCAEHSSYQTDINDEMLQELTKMAEAEYANMLHAQLKNYTAYCEVCSNVSKIFSDFLYWATENLWCPTCGNGARM